MRFRLASFVVAAATLAIAACSDQPRPTAPPNESALLSRSYSDKKCQLELEKFAEDFAKGKKPQDNQGQAMQLAKLSECSGGSIPGNFFTSPDVLIDVVSPTDPPKTIVSSNQDFEVEIPTGFFSVPVVITGARQPDSDPPLTSGFVGNEYLLYTQITATPPHMETKGNGKAIVQICPYFPAGSELYLSHPTSVSDLSIVQVHETGGQITLPFAKAAPLAACSTTDPATAYAALTAPDGFSARTLAAAIRALKGASGYAVRVITPAKLFAATMFVDGGVGGFADDFSSFFLPCYLGCSGEGAVAVGNRVGPFGPLTTRPDKAAIGPATRRPQ